MQCCTLSPAARGVMTLACLAAAGCGSTAKDAETEEYFSLVAVDVDPSSVLTVVPTHAYGLHSSVYDNELHDPALPEQLEGAGVTLLRYPGGGYSDNYHWSTHTMSPWLNVREDGSISRDHGYLAAGSDFGSFVSVLERTGASAMLTVNYGSNLGSDGPGEPKEAAAWVAYANGNPEDATELGLDSTGEDWHTVGYWASLRASEALDDDDGRNFLRISHPEPLGIEYWEVGNEVYGNGYYDEPGFEHDLHAPYEAGVSRSGHEALSPHTYGAGVARFAAAMKKVDPTIRVGAVLATPPDDYDWARDWNPGVLAECGDQIDFGILHWYPRDTSLLRAPTDTLEPMFAILEHTLEEALGESGPELEIVVTEVGPPPGYSREVREICGLFAADAYLGFIAHGVTNVDWLELHNATFLSGWGDELGPAYHGVTLAHRVAEPGDALVEVESERPARLVAHAAKRADGKMTLLLINTDPRILAIGEVSVDGDPLADEAEVYVYAPRTEGDEGIVASEPLLGGDNAWSVRVAPESATLVVFSEASPQSEVSATRPTSRVPALEFTVR